MLCAASAVLPAVLGGVLLSAVALVLVAAVSYQCAVATWRKFLRMRGWRMGSTGDSGVEAGGAQNAAAAVRISHSLPDLQHEVPAKTIVPETRPCQRTGEIKKVRVHLLS